MDQAARMTLALAQDPFGPNGVLPRDLAGAVDGLDYRILVGDAASRMADLAPGSVACIVCSPPYFWQRDYDHPGQIGHEPSIAGYVDALALVFREAIRVLSRDGTLFLNLGDAYYNAKGRPHGTDPKHAARNMSRQVLRAVDGPGLGLPRKSLIGMPWRVALALQDIGWTLRSSIVWKRPNSLGESASLDRPWRTHENVFMFSRSDRYFFDRSALRGEEDIWTISARPENPYAHCAPYPEELAARCIACGAKPGGVVLDPFLGSGTTMMAALRAGHPAAGIELNERFATLAERRLALALPPRIPGL